MTETRTDPSWLSTAGVIRNGGIRPPGTEGMGASTGTTKRATKVEKDTSWSDGSRKAPAKVRPATTPEKPITGDRVIFEGLYKFGDTRARVKKSATSGKLYVLVENESGSWEYEGRAPLASLKASDRIEESKAQPNGPSVTEGFYMFGAGTAEVVRSKAGRLYATVLDVQTGRFNYVAGAVNRIRPEDRLTLDEAIARGKKFHRCMCCGKELTKQESIDRGIGPICAGKL